jgi:hypothetical protein
MAVVVGIAFGVSASASGDAGEKPGVLELEGVPAADVSGNPALPVGPDLAGYTVVSAGPFLNPSGQQSPGSVMCPSGTVPFGGGGYGASHSLLQAINSSYPINGPGWQVDMNNLSFSDSTFTVFAVCAKRPKYFAVAAADFYTPAQGQTGGAVSCPYTPGGKHMRVFGGGAGGSFSPYESFNSSFPVISGWHVRMNNVSGFDEPFTVVALCGLSKGYKIVVGPLVFNPAGEQTVARVSCPAGLAAVGGGVFSDATSVNVSVNSTWPDTGSSWESYENNNSSSSRFIRPYVVCLK